MSDTSYPRLITFTRHCSEYTVMITYMTDTHIIIVITLRVDIFEHIAGQSAKGRNVTDSNGEEIWAHINVFLYSLDDLLSQTRFIVEVSEGVSG